MCSSVSFYQSAEYQLPTPQDMMSSILHGVYNWQWCIEYISLVCLCASCQDYSMAAVSTSAVSTICRLLREKILLAWSPSEVELYSTANQPLTWSTNQLSVFHTTPPWRHHWPIVRTTLCRQMSVTSQSIAEADSAGYHLHGSWPVLLAFDWSTNSECFPTILLKSTEKEG